MQEDYRGSHSRIPMTITYMLISLTGRSLVREEIISRVEKYSSGLVRLSPWILQEKLSFMLQQKWIERDPTRKGHPYGPDYYRLLPLGRGAIAAQIERMEEMVTLVKTHLGRQKEEKLCRAPEK